jgi:hypothetical protein
MAHDVEPCKMIRCLEIKIRLEIIDEKCFGCMFLVMEVIGEARLPVTSTPMLGLMFYVLS